MTQQKDWAHQEAARLQPLLRGLYKALNSGDWERALDTVREYDLDDILLGAADILNVLANPITVVYPE